MVLDLSSFFLYIALFGQFAMGGIQIGAGIRYPEEKLHNEDLLRFTIVSLFFQSCGFSVAQFAGYQLSVNPIAGAVLAGLMMVNALVIMVAILKSFNQPQSKRALWILTGIGVAVFPVILGISVLL